MTAHEEGFMWLQTVKKRYNFFDLIAKQIAKHTVVGDNIMTMKTTFDLNFDLYEAVKQLVKNKK